jgi:hypothetical protein
MFPYSVPEISIPCANAVSPFRVMVPRFPSDRAVGTIECPTGRHVSGLRLPADNSKQNQKSEVPHMRINRGEFVLGS